MMQIKNFPLEAIIISEDFLGTTPGASKMQRAREKYNTAADMVNCITVNDEGVLIDGYTAYLRAKELNLEAVDIKRGYVELIGANHYPSGRILYWKVPERLQGNIEPGMKCYVRTSQGVARVTVREIIRQQYPAQNPRLRNVVKLL